MKKLDDKGDVMALDDYEKIEYEGLNEDHRERWKIYKDNRNKAYSVIFGYCNKKMQDRILGISDYESRVKNNPYELLDEIKRKMYDPEADKYPFISMTDFLYRLLVTRQDDGEELVDFIKRFKQTRDNLVGTVGSNFLDKFIERTGEYKKAYEDNDNDECKKLKDKAVEKWMAYLFM